MAVIEYDAAGKRIAKTVSVVQLFRMFPDGERARLPHPKIGDMGR